MQVLHLLLSYPFFFSGRQGRLEEAALVLAEHFVTEKSKALWREAPGPENHRQNLGAPIAGRPWINNTEDKCWKAHLQYYARAHGLVMRSKSPHNFARLSWASLDASSRQETTSSHHPRTFSSLSVSPLAHFVHPSHHDSSFPACEGSPSIFSMEV